MAQGHEGQRQPIAQEDRRGRPWPREAFRIFHRHGAGDLAQDGHQEIEPAHKPDAEALCLSYILPMSRVNTSITAYTVTCSLTKLARIPRWRGYFSEDMIRLNEAFTRHSRTTALQYLLSWLPPG